MRIQYLLFSCLILSSNLFAQQLPNTNILLFDFDQKNDTTFRFSNPQFLTDFNKNGYNNQPYFISDNELYITAQFSDDTTQTDIYSLNLSKNKLTQVTRTIESEYSPTFVPPRTDNRNYEFSCVRVEKDGSQRLWKFPVNRTSYGNPVFTNIKNIGYHHWIDYRDIVIFSIGDPHKMLVADSRDESTRYVTSNIGRCFKQLPNGDVAYIEKISDETWLLKKMDFRSYKTSLITATITKGEDFEVLRDGTIIMSSGSKLYKFNQRKDVTWQEIADFSYYGMKAITRLAINAAQNKIAVVIQ